MDPWIHLPHFDEATEAYDKPVDADLVLLRLAEKGFCPGCLATEMRAMPIEIQAAFTLGLVIGVDARDIAQAELN